VNKYSCRRCKRRWYSAVTDLTACQVCGGALAPLPLNDTDRLTDAASRPPVFKLWTKESPGNGLPPGKPREA